MTRCRSHSASRPADDVIALVDRSDESRAIRIVDRDGTIEARPAPAEPADRTMVARPVELLLGALGRRPATGVLADYVARYGPF